MRRVGKKINLFFIIIIIILLSFILLMDAEQLNSLLVNYDELIVDEVAILKTETINNTSNENAMPIVIENTISNPEPTMMNKIAFTDYWAWPTDSNYTITSSFGYRWGRLHDAIDISGTGYGTNIYAANNGIVTVAKSGCNPGYTSCNGKAGNYIIINHNSNNYYTIYMHLKDIKVSVGEIVTRGQIIGTMGNTGNVVPVPTNSSPYAGTHLHFALYIGEPYKGGYAVNPMRLY